MGWAYLTWFPEHGAEKIHRDDMALFDRGVQGILAEVLRVEDGWQVVKFQNQEARVSPTVAIDCPAPPFEYGARVMSVPPRSPIFGEVAAIIWHFEAKQPYYVISAGGKNVKSRYWARELAPWPQPSS